MIASIIHHRPRPAATFLSVLALSVFGYATASASPPDPNKIKTATPIKHVVVIVGENRSFNHLFATYVPRARGETVKNLLSEKIINADGTPGKHFALGRQYKIISPPNGGKYFISADLKYKQRYTILPAPRCEWRAEPARCLDP